MPILNIFNRSLIFRSVPKQHFYQVTTKNIIFNYFKLHRMNTCFLLFKSNLSLYRDGFKEDLLAVYLTNSCKAIKHDISDNIENDKMELNAQFRNMLSYFQTSIEKYCVTHNIDTTAHFVHFDSSVYDNGLSQRTEFHELITPNELGIFITYVDFYLEQIKIHHTRMNDLFSKILYAIVGCLLGALWKK